VERFLFVFAVLVLTLDYSRAAHANAWTGRVIAFTVAQPIQYAKSVFAAAFLFTFRGA